MRLTLLTAAVAALALAGCARAPANLQTIVSDDCGVNWRLIKVGDAVPAGTGNPCFVSATIPNYPLQGESTFRGTFSGKVRVSANSSYDYSIIDPLKFVANARFIAKGGVTNDDSAKYDQAESIIIDRLLREVANSADFLPSEDVVDFNQGEFEDRLLVEMNTRLAERGVQLNTFTFVVTPDDQTRNMIDIAAAYRVCATIQGLTPQVCEQILTARAGASRVQVGRVDD